MRSIRPLRLLLIGSICCAATSARADVPAGYKGTPYKGTPQTIPGRVELANLDLGGEGVAYHADHRRVNAKAEGYSPLSGDDYRVGELDLPDICRTNNFAPPDTWDDGRPYPTAAREFWYYMGLAHSVDWAKVTVDVKQAGTYNVSTNFASAETQTGCSIWFNDGTAPAAAGDTHLDGVNKSGNLSFAGTGQYHTWKAYPNLATVTLGAGLQVMTFHLRQNHLQYGFLQFDLVGADGGVVVAVDAGASNDAGSMTTPDVGVSGEAGGSGSSGQSGQSGQAGQAGSSAGSDGEGSGGAGGLSMPPTGGTNGGGAGATASGAGGSAPHASGASGCAVAASASAARTWSSLFAGLAIVLGALVRRRRTRG
jgi:MYXO-CTERM domain-containing protein